MRICHRVDFLQTQCIIDLNCTGEQASANEFAVITNLEDDKNREKKR